MRKPRMHGAFVSLLTAFASAPWPASGPNGLPFSRAGNQEADVSALVVAYTAAEQRRLIAGIVSIGLGVLIFAVPRLLNYIVAAYFVVVGVLLIIEATD
jgi:Protein of unknown function (DUF3096)